MTRPSYLATVSEVLSLISGALDTAAKHPTVALARRSVTTTRPQALYFMAWELYYKNPHAKRDTFDAMNGN